MSKRKKLNKTNQAFIGFFDGATYKKNPCEIVGLGSLIKDSNGTTIASYSEAIHLTGTNNVAEWLSLLALLKMAIRYGIEKLIVYGDSDLIIQQATGKYKVKAENLKQYKREEVRIKVLFKQLDYFWIPRDQNAEADNLSKMCFNSFNL